MYYQITYLNELTGKRATYMNVGFESKRLARHELERILKAQENHKHLYSPDVIANCIKNNIHIPSYVIGSDYKIRPIKLLNRILK
jgi:hypothetical protein